MATFYIPISPTYKTSLEVYREPGWRAELVAGPFGDGYEHPSDVVEFVADWRSIDPTISIQKVLIPLKVDAHAEQVIGGVASRVDISNDRVAVEFSLLFSDYFIIPSELEMA